MVHKRIYNYLQEQDILCKTRFGFRKGLSTDLTILKLVDRVNDAFDNSLIPAALFLDIKKAFDTIDHDKLLQILKSIGIHNVPLKWFHSYFSNRAQVLHNVNLTSEHHFIPCRVPQRSILGPLLFYLC